MRTQRKNLEHFATFGNSGYALDDLQIFRNVNDQRVAVLLADCAVLQLAAGQSVADATSKGAHLYVVLRGSLQIGAELHADSRPDTLDGTVTRVLPGECAGELSVLDEETQTAAMSALEETDLLVIDRDTLWKLVDESNGVARNLLRLLAFRVRAANVQIRRRQKVGEFYRQLSLVDGMTDLQNRDWLKDNMTK